MNLDVGDRLVSVGAPGRHTYRVGMSVGGSNVYSITVDRLTGPEAYFLIAHVVFEGKEPDVVIPLHMADFFEFQTGD